MADATYQIGVEALYDNTQLIAGVQQAEAAIETIETSAEETATAASTAFDRIPAAVDTTSTSLISTSGRKLKSAGKTIGADLATSITSGVQSGDIVGSVSGIFTSLAAVGGAAAIGVGIGGAFITNFIKGMNAEKAALYAEINSVLEKVEDDFKGSLSSIMKTINQEASEISVLTDFGGEAGLAGGLDRANLFAEKLGVSLQDVTTLLQGKTGPAAEQVLDYLQEQVGETQDIYRGGVKIGESETERSRIARTLIGFYDAQEGKLDAAKQNAYDLYQLQHDTRREIEDAVTAASNYADESERAEAATRRISELLAGLVAPRLNEVSAQLNGLF